MTTIYNTINNHRQYLRAYLACPIKRKRCKSDAKVSRIPQRNDIRMCNQTQNMRNFGHWEADMVVGPQGGGKECIVVFVEKLFRAYITIKIPDKTAKSMKVAKDFILATLSGVNVATFRRMKSSIAFPNFQPSS